MFSFILRVFSHELLSDQHQLNLGFHSQESSKINSMCINCSCNSFLETPLNSSEAYQSASTRQREPIRFVKLFSLIFVQGFCFLKRNCHLNLRSGNDNLLNVALWSLTTLDVFVPLLGPLCLQFTWRRACQFCGFLLTSTWGLKHSASFLSDS